jgi:prepilin-type N-terminal cleavage/methylation domain-containing protein
VPRLTPPARARRRRAGFTLPELLVAATLLVLVGAALNTLFVGQVRTFVRTQGRTRMQRDLRTGLALLPLDLRGAARDSRTLADLTDLRDSSLQLRATIGASVVCARPAASQVDLPPLGTARNTLTAWYTQPAVGDTVLLYNDSTSAGAEDDVWTPRAITAIASGAAGACPGAPFTDPVADAGKARWRLTLGGLVPDSVRVGAPVRFLRSVKYSLFQPAGGSQWYLGYRELLGNSWSAAQPIAGPFEAYSASGRTGLRFAYFDTLGVALTTPAAGTRVGRVDLVFRTRALVRGGARDSVVLRDSIATRIALRNRL